MRALNITPHVLGGDVDLASSSIAADALYTTLATILRDNSAFDSQDHTLAREWLTRAGCTV